MDYFSLSLCGMYPCVPEERGVPGGKDRIETVWSRWGRRVGMHSQVGVADLSGVRTAHYCTVLRTWYCTRPVQYHTTVRRLV